MKRPKLGEHLEWHGNSIRVVLAVPPTLRKVIGSNKLRKVLPTGKPREADILKLSVLIQMREQIAQARDGKETGDLLMRRALLWREQLNAARDSADDDEDESPHRGLCSDGCRKIGRFSI